MYLVPPTNIFWILADILEIVFVLIIINVILSWGIMMGSVSRFKPWVRNLFKLTDPILEPFRKIVPPHILKGIDISPFIAGFLIQVVQGFLYRAGSGG